MSLEVVVGKREVERQAAVDALRVKFVEAVVPPLADLLDEEEPESE